MPITGHGWEIHVVRLGLQIAGPDPKHQRTYGEYQVYRNGTAVADLKGNICECIGPGDRVVDSGHRVLPGHYPLWTQFEKFRTIGYSNDLQHAGTPHMPGFRLEETGRSGILIHPAHPPDLYLSSIGCLNPTKPLGRLDKVDFWDSRQRVIDLIDSLHAFAPSAFAKEEEVHIANAWAVIDGEPNNVL